MERKGERPSQNGNSSKPPTQEAAAAMIKKIDEIADLGLNAMLDGSGGIFVPSRRRLSRRYRYSRPR